MTFFVDAPYVVWHSLSDILFKVCVISQIHKFLIKKLICVLFVGQAKEEVFPELLNFLEKCDAVKSSRKQSAAMVSIPGQWDFSFFFLLDNWKDTLACGFSKWPLLSSHRLQESIRKIPSAKIPKMKFLYVEQTFGPSRESWAFVLQNNWTCEKWICIVVKMLEGPRSDIKVCTAKLHTW